MRYNPWSIILRLCLRGYSPEEPSSRSSTMSRPSAKSIYSEYIRHQGSTLTDTVELSLITVAVLPSQLCLCLYFFQCRGRNIQSPLQKVLTISNTGLRCGFIIFYWDNTICSKNRLSLLLLNFCVTPHTIHLYVKWWTVNLSYTFRFVILVTDLFPL